MADWVRSGSWRSVASALAIPAVFAASSVTPAHGEARSPAEIVAFLVWGLEPSAKAERIDAGTWLVTPADGTVSRFEIT